MPIRKASAAYPFTVRACVPQRIQRTPEGQHIPKEKNSHDRRTQCTKPDETPRRTRHP